MKLFKIVLGTVLAAWAVGVMIGGFREVRFDTSTPGITSIFAYVAAVGMVTLSSIWSFQSAFRKPESRSQPEASPPQNRIPANDEADLSTPPD